MNPVHSKVLWTNFLHQTLMTIYLVTWMIFSYSTLIKQPMSNIYAVPWTNFAITNYMKRRKFAYYEQRIKKYGMYSRIKQTISRLIQNISSIYIETSHLHKILQKFMGLARCNNQYTNYFGQICAQLINLLSKYKTFIWMSLHK